MYYRLDKMIDMATKLNRMKTFNPVHIIEGDYCRSCNGKCIYSDNEQLQIKDNVIIIFGEDEILD